MLNKIEFSYLFSYWILCWFFLYYIYFILLKNNNKYRAIINPIHVFIFALIENLVALAIIMVVSYKPLSLYLMMILFMKLIPLYILRNEPILWCKSFIFTIVVFLIYNLYLNYNQTNIYEIYTITMNSLLENRNETPGYAFINKYILRIN
jgi:hypothetical protein